MSHQETQAARNFTGDGRNAGALQQAQQGAEAAEAGLRAVFSAMTDAVIVADTDGRLIEANTAGRAFLDVSENADLPPLSYYLTAFALFETDGARIPPEQRPLARALAGEVVPWREVRVVKPDGATLWALVSGVPARANDGRVIGGVLTAHDITERHEARQALEQALRDTEMQRRILENLFDNIPYTHVAFFDRNGALIRINPDGPKLLGYETAEAFADALRNPLGWRVMTADGTPIAPEEWPLSRALRGERFDSQEYHVVNPDGYQAAFLMNGGPVAWDVNGNVTMAVNVGHDIRELRHLMNLADQERAQYQTLTEFIPQLIWSTSPDGKATYFNSRWEEFTGTPTADLLGTGWMRDLHPEDRPKVAAEWATACEFERDYEIEYRLRGRDGAYRHFLARGKPVRDATGQIVQMVGTTTDITPQVQEREQSQLLAQISQDLRADFDPLMTLHQVTQTLGTYMSVTRIYYSVAKPAEKTLTILSEYRQKDEQVSLLGTYPLPDNNPMMERLAAGETVVIADVALDPISSESASRYYEFQVQSLVAVPIQTEGLWQANLVVADDRPRAWGRDQVAFIEAMAERTRLAIENARLYQAEREKSQRLTDAFAETHHRVKNNLQVIAALLDLRAMEGEEDEPISRDDLRRMTSQVRAIAAVHDFLSHNQAAMTVSGRDVVRRLVPMVAQTAGITATWAADDMVLTVKQGTALALALNELVSNAGKHGATRIHVRLTAMQDLRLLEALDNGPGFPPNFDPRANANQGLTLVISLAERDLQGTITFDNAEDGGRVCIRFPATQNT